MELNDHEEARRQCIEENRKRMQEIGLLHLVESMRPEKQSKPPGRKHVGRKEAKLNTSPQKSARLGSRRSSRTASKLPVDYKEETSSEDEYSGSILADAAASNRYILSTPADVAVVEAVDEAYSKLANPGFLRHVLYTYGAGSRHAYIPLAFRCEHMPETDKCFTLQDEDQMQWKVLFNSEYGELRKGWKAFSVHHALMAGDCCLFELVSPFRFIVRIFRYDQHDDGGSRSRMGSNRKRVSDEGQSNEKVSIKSTSAIPEDFDVVVDRKPKLEAEILEDHRSGGREQAGLALPIESDPKVIAEPVEDHQSAPREAHLGTPIDRDPKVKPEPVEDYHRAQREADLSILIDQKPKLEVENFENHRSADPQHFSSPFPASMPIRKSANWTLDNPD